MIVVSLTSYPARINQVYTVLQSIYAQTLKPDIVVLTLSLKEFPNKKISKELSELEDSGKLKIKWVKENYYTWKEFPDIFNDYPEDYIILIDDDVIYPDFVIELLVSDFEKNGKTAPITGGWHQWKKSNNIFSNHGAFSLIMRKFVEPYFSEMYETIKPDIIRDYKSCMDDPFLTYCCLLNGIFYIPCSKDLTKEVKYISYKENFSDGSGKKTWWHKHLGKIIQKKYGILRKDLWKNHYEKLRE